MKLWRYYNVYDVAHIPWCHWIHIYLLNIDGKCFKGYNLVFDTGVGNYETHLYRRSDKDGGKVAFIQMQSSNINVDNWRVVAYWSLLDDKYKRKHISINI